MIPSPGHALLRGPERSDRFPAAQGAARPPEPATAGALSERPAASPELTRLAASGRRSRSGALDGTASQRRAPLPPAVPDEAGLAATASFRSVASALSGAPVPARGSIGRQPSAGSTFFSARMELPDEGGYDAGRAARFGPDRSVRRSPPDGGTLERSDSSSSSDLDTVEPRGVAREEAAQGSSGAGAGAGPGTTAAQFRQRIAAHLAAMPLAPDVRGRAELQAQMEAEYVAWAGERLLERHRAYGETGGYRFGESMDAVGLPRASVAIAYESLKGFMTSATRTPPGGAIAVLQGNRDSERASRIRPAALGGLMAGAANYLVESILIPAMDRRARVANMPAFKPVDPKVLIPDPAPVQLEVTADGAKRFWRPVRDSEVGRRAVTESVDRPTRNALRGAAHDDRKLAETRQKLMDGKAEATLLKPVLTATANALRRWASDAAALASPGKALGFGAVASGTASAVNKAALETTKALPRTGQVDVPDLLGGTQRVNLFRLAVPDETQAPLRWSDAKRLPGFAWNVVQEAVPLLGEAVRTGAGAFHAARDFFVRSVGGNVVIGAVAASAGLQFASIVRGRYGVPNSGEATDSIGSVMQQAGQSFFSELGWNGWKALMGDISGELAARLDRRRDQTQERLWREARAEMRGLDQDLHQALSPSLRAFAPPVLPPRGAVSGIDTGIGTGADAAPHDLEEGQASRARVPDLRLRQATEAARASVEELLDFSPQGIIEKAAVAQAAGRLRRLTGHYTPATLAAEGLDVPRLQRMQARLERVQRLLEQREALLAWREGPRPHAE